MRLSSFLSIALSLAALPLHAHEFWISPDEYTVEPGGRITAELRVGQDFNGPGYAYIPQNFKRFDLVRQEGTAPVEGRVGDRPALDVPAGAAGLVTVVHQTKDYRLTYDSFDIFREFGAHKAFPEVAERHLERGLSEDLVREIYTRYGKSLVAVGDGAGMDREVGLRTEIVALANPYTDALPDGLPVRVLYEGAPRAGVQVEVYARAPDGTVSVSKYQTDAAGEARIPVEAGTEYLVDSVVMLELEVTEPEDAAWHSLWASLTFRRP
jgi:hypothetical protein